MSVPSPSTSSSTTTTTCSSSSGSDSTRLVPASRSTRVDFHATSTSANGRHLDDAASTSSAARRWPCASCAATLAFAHGAIGVGGLLFDVATGRLPVASPPSSLVTPAALAACCTAVLAAIAARRLDRAAQFLLLLFACLAGGCAVGVFLESARFLAASGSCTKQQFCERSHAVHATLIAISLTELVTSLVTVLVCYRSLLRAYGVASPSGSPYRTLIAGDLRPLKVFRHADRAPINLPENLSILPPELVARFWRGSGQILDSGIDAASQLGACLRVRYVDGGARVLDGRMIPGQFSLRSSPVTRCVQTGQAVVAKMFNGSAGPASPVPVYLPVGDGEPNIALPRSCRFDRLPPSSGNPVSQKIALELAANKSTYWREHSVGQNEIFADMVALNASLVPDWYSPEAAAEARQIYAQVGRTLFFSNPNATTDPEIAVAIGPLISHILNIFGNYSTNSASSMGRPVFTAHDFVIDILAVALNLSDRLETVKPPFLSTFLVELWQLPDVEGGYGVKIYFGNASCDFRDLTSLARGCGGNSSCPLSSFSTAFRPLASTDPLNCPPLDVAFSTGTGGIAAAEPSALQLILATPGLLIGWFTPLAVFFLLAALSLGAFSIYLYKRAGQLAEQLEKALKDRRSLQQGLSNSSRAGSGGSPAAGSPVHFTAPPPPGTTVVVEQIPAAQPPPPKPAAPLRHDYPTDARVL